MLTALKQTNILTNPSSIGIGVMAVATVVGMLKMPNHSVNRYILPGQVVRIQSNDLYNLNNPIRREKEDTAPIFVSYSESQRTPSRSGKY